MLDLSVPPLRLLLIDDSTPVRQVLARLLRAAGHTVVEAETGAAGLALLRQHPLDLVVTDRDMPGLTGWDVALLAKAAYPQLPVVLVTGGTGGAEQEQQAPAPIDAILRKPFPFAELLAVIGHLTRGDTPARGGMADGPETGQRETSLRQPVSAPGTPVGSGADADHLHRRMRRSLATSER